MDDKSELIACIETGNFARAARIAAGKLVVCAEALPALAPARLLLLFSLFLEEIEKFLIINCYDKSVQVC